MELDNENEAFQQIARVNKICVKTALCKNKSKHNGIIRYVGLHVQTRQKKKNAKDVRHETPSNYHHQIIVRKMKVNIRI